MPDYEKMYFRLAAKVADAADLLIEALRQGENEYIESETNTAPPAAAAEARDGGKGEPESR